MPITMLVKTIERRWTTITLIQMLSRAITVCSSLFVSGTAILMLSNSLPDLEMFISRVAKREKERGQKQGERNGEVEVGGEWEGKRRRRWWKNRRGEEEEEVGRGGEGEAEVKGCRGDKKGGGMGGGRIGEGREEEEEEDTNERRGCEG